MAEQAVERVRTELRARPWPVVDREGGFMRRNRTTWAGLFLMATAALIVTGGCENRPPDAPFLLGPAEGKVGEGLSFSLSSVDPDRDPVACRVAWGDGDTSDWSPAAFSGDTVRLTHTWSSDDVYSLYGQAKDQHGIVSDWSERLTVEVLPGDSNQPPAVPVLLGPEEGKAGDNLSFSVSSVDPDSDLVAYRIDWDDDNFSEWSQPAFSGDTVTLTHSWLAPDGYWVRAQAKDQHGNVSEWSDDLRLHVLPSVRPSVPVLLGPTTGDVGAGLSYSVSSTDPEGDLVAYRIAWGDGDTSDWSQAVFSGDTVNLTHSWTSANTYSLHAQAKDQHGNESPWSAGLTLQVGPSDFPDTVIATVPVGASTFDPCVTPDGQYVYVPNLFDNTVSVIRTADNTEVTRFALSGRPSAAVASHDGQYVYISLSSSSSVVRVRTSDNSVTDTIATPTDPWELAMSPDGNYLYAGLFRASSYKVAVIRLADDSVIATPDVGCDPWGLAVTPDGAYLYIALWVDDHVSVMRTADNTLVDTIPVGHQLNGLAMSPDGQFVYVAAESSDAVYVIRTSDNSVVATVPIADQPTGVAALPNGRYVYVASYASDYVSVIRTSDYTVVKQITVGTRPDRFAVLPDGSAVYATTHDQGYVAVIGSR